MTPRKEFKVELDNGVFLWVTDASNDLPNIVPQSVKVDGTVFRSGDFIKITDADGELHTMFVVEIGVDPLPR